VAANKKKNRYETTLSALARQLGKASIKKAREPLEQAFVILAACGDVPRTEELLRWMHASDVPSETWHALSQSAVDVFCHVAGLPDYTKGKSINEQSMWTGLEETMPLAERVPRHDTYMRWRLADYLEKKPTLDWKKLKGEKLWVAARTLAALKPDNITRPDTELEALAALDKYLTGFDTAYGHGSELPLALDLALRHGKAELVPKWFEAMGSELHEYIEHYDVLPACLSIEAVARAIVEDGLLQPVVGLTEPQRESALRNLETALGTARANAGKKAPAVQKRAVTIEYNQLYLEPETLSPEELEQVYFQDARETDQGFSLFATKAAIGTPSDALECHVEVSLATTVPELGDAIRAVAIPLDVRGPMQLRSVSSGDENDPLQIPLGRYDILARFHAVTKKSKGPLEKFRVSLTLHPPGSLGAPKCLRIEMGHPPRSIYVAGTALPRAK
jgi:hypothetical protein